MLKIFCVFSLTSILSSSILLANPNLTHPKDQTQLKTPETERNNPTYLAAAAIEAARAAQDYVDLLDRGLYAESWNRGAILFRKTISQNEWVYALQLARKKLGGVKSRTMKDERIAWDPPGLPRGAYMVVEYNTSFDRVPNSGELLTLMQERDGSWKVLTYQVN